jgi:hypothetical protein
MPRNETYGDGVYASFDGFMIWLRTARETGDHVIALEPEVFNDLAEFARRCWAIRDPRATA